MAPHVGSDGHANVQFVLADTPVKEVNVSIVGLTGTPRAAALVAASSAKSAKTLGGLDQVLRSDVVQQLGHAARQRGSDVVVEVSPGSKKGLIDVVFREKALPVDSWCYSAQWGFDGRLDSMVGVHVEQVKIPSIAPDGTPWRFRAGAHYNFVSQVRVGTLLLKPPTLPGGIIPSIELGMGEGYLIAQSLFAGLSS